MQKYRAWLKDIEAMAEVYSINFLSKKVSSVIAGVAWIKHLDEVILMQSTGMFDDTGKEIFEGDVVEYYGATYIVKSGPFFFQEKSIPLIGFYVMRNGRKIPLFPSDPYDVLGNIYEHPELLEVENGQ